MFSVYSHDLLVMFICTLKITFSFKINELLCSVFVVNNNIKLLLIKCYLLMKCYCWKNLVPKLCQALM